MNISLLISGNLTGFGRFYTSPAAKELLGNEKIDLDNHNHLTFLGNDERAYSITFAKRYIAISQYTQILDSFRRPGKLVVSVLVPRNYMVVPNSGLPKGAVYSLLTKISDKFFEKNFQDGMIYQNPAVLGQDYYSDILDGYSLVPSDNRRINEDPSPVKKIGYVRATELDVPSYLDTPYRKSYGEGGYNLVFFAPSAPVGTPNSIDEEPVEVVLYRVRILNTGAILPNPVKLSAPLYKLQAKLGEKAFSIEGTYKDAVDHLLEPRITARILPGEIVEVSYNFEKDEKTIKFVFIDMATSTPVSLDSVLPSISFADGSRQPISSETFTFRGAEIYDNKRLISDSSEFSISPRSERLDLLRLSDNQELKVYVQQGFNLPVDPNFTNLTITFVNKSTGETKSFSNQNMIHLPGGITDWNVYVDTDNYVAPIQAVTYRNGRFCIQGLQRRVKNITNNADVKTKPASTEIAVQTNVPTLNLSGGKYQNDSVEKWKVHKLKWHKYLILIPIILIIFGGGWWGYKAYIEKPRPVDPSGELDSGERYCGLMYFDNTEDLTYRDSIENCNDTESNKHYSKYKFMVLDQDRKPLDNNYYSLEDSNLYYNSKEYFRQRLTISKNCDSDTFYIRVLYECGENFYQIVDESISEDTLNTHGTQFVNLGILISQLSWYKKLVEMKKFESQDKKQEWIDKIVNLKPSEYKDSLMFLAEHMEISGADQPVVTNTTPVPALTLETSDSETIPDGLKGNSTLTADKLKEMYLKKPTARNIYNRAQAMAKALDKVNNLEKVDQNGLDEVQKKTIEKYNGVIDGNNENLKKILQAAKARNELSSFYRLWNVIRDF